MIFFRNYFIPTTSEVDVRSIIHEVNRALREAGASEGLVTVSVPAPGGAITIIEPLPDVVEHLKAALAVFPGQDEQIKNRRKEEIAVGPRVVGAMIGKTLTVPFSAGKLALGPREEIILIDLEKGGRRREFAVQVMGEGGEKAKQQAGRAQQPRGR